jgi:hypothetical protein
MTKNKEISDVEAKNISNVHKDEDKQNKVTTQ